MYLKTVTNSQLVKNKCQLSNAKFLLMSSIILCLLLSVRLHTNQWLITISRLADNCQPYG